MGRERTSTAGRTAALIALLLVGSCGGGDAKRGQRTVVLVTVDTLRRDHVGAFAPKDRPSPAATPRIDALAKEGIRFSDARTPAVLTLPAHVTMMSGLPPAVHGARSNSASRVPPASARAWRTVAEILRERGRCTGAFVSAGPLVARYGLDAGFDAYDDEGLASRTGLSYEERPGTATVDRALAWLRGLPEGHAAFLWVHVFEPHEPYPSGYARDVEAADAVVGRLLDGLASAGRGDAAVVLTSDHGEALGDQGERSHGFLLAENVLRVPLIVRAPGIAAAVREDAADLSDVAPLCLRLAGEPWTPSATPGSGVDLLAGPSPTDRARVAEALHAWHQCRWAQLSAAVVGPWRLEDRGLGRERLHRIDPASATGLDAGAAAEGRPESAAPAAALRAYRRVEDRKSADGGAAPGGYGRGGAAGFFLEPAENARRPDPYEAIEDAYRVNQAAALILAGPPLPRIEKALGDLGSITARDPSNPSVAFWQGRGLRTLARHGEAVAAFRRALDLGGCESEALLLLLRSAAAGGDPAAGVAAYERCGRALAADARVLEAAAVVYEAAKQPERAAELRRDAEKAAVPPPTAEPRPCR